MEEILDNLVIGEILYSTQHGTDYLFMYRTNDGGVVYSINQDQKTLPINTIISAYNDFNHGILINAQWYRNYNQLEYESRGCNLPVLTELLTRINN